MLFRSPPKQARQVRESMHGEDIARQEERNNNDWLAELEGSGAAGNKQALTDSQKNMIQAAPRGPGPRAIQASMETLGLFQDKKP